MTEAKNPLATALGPYYPMHYVVAVVDDPALATQALIALKDAGFEDAAVEIFPGPEFLRNYRDFVEHRNLLQRVEGLFPAEEQAAVQEYLAEAEGGASFVTVHVTEPRRRDQVRDVLRTHGGHAMRYYGDNTITDL